MDYSLYLDLQSNQNKKRNICMYLLRFCSVPSSVFEHRKALIIMHNNVQLYHLWYLHLGENLVIISFILTIVNCDNQNTH